VTDGDDERCQTVSAFVELMADLGDIQDSAPLSVCVHRRGVRAVR